MAKNPKVFISYSHDSPEHKQWVSELASQLRHNGVDAILDQWDLGLGDDITRFMELGIVDADRVLVICTDKYVSKANATEGGVGYERMIVNAELVQNLGTDKFIPIIRQASGKEKTPAFLGTRVYADFRRDSQFDEECKKLIHELHEVPIVQKPPLGKSPFPSVQLDTQLTEIPECVESTSAAYEKAFKLVRAGDVLGWRQLVKQIRPNVFESLVRWRQGELDGQEPKSEEIFQIVDKAVGIISPLMVVALAGVESGREEFKDQKSLLDDLLNITGWDSIGDTTWVRIPYALGYVYHSLHGNLSLTTNQLDLALNLARVKIPCIYNRKKLFHVWKIHELVGWASSFGPNCVDGWTYLVNAYKRWEWLSLIFADDMEYRSSLVAYYMILNVHELAELIDSDRGNELNDSYSLNLPFEFDVPLTFMFENQEIYQRAISLLRRNPESLTQLWTGLNVTQEQMKYSWENWVCLFDNWLTNVYRSSTGRALAVSRQTYYQNFLDHQDLFNML